MVKLYGRESSEVELAGHPDIFSSTLSAQIVNNFAQRIFDNHGIDGLSAFRSDLNVQISNDRNSNLKINVVGQLLTPGLNIYEINELIRSSTLSLLVDVGYNDLARPSKIILNSEGIIPQSQLLTKTTNGNYFADSCIVYGHHLSAPFGMNGNFPSLVIATELKSELENILRKNNIPGLKPDGKIHVQANRRGQDLVIDRVYASIAHSGDITDTFRSSVNSIFEPVLARYDPTHGPALVNAGGDFNIYFTNADAGVSGKKDGVIITGGHPETGTDGVWGKCQYKASSVALPYAFALSRAVAESLQIKYISIGVRTEYGQKNAELLVNDIDPEYGLIVDHIEKALEKLPKDRDSIRRILGTEVTPQTYHTFNDVANFHNPTNPWKRENHELNNLFREAYKSVNLF